MLLNQTLRNSIAPPIQYQFHTSKFTTMTLRLRMTTLKQTKKIHLIFFFLTTSFFSFGFDILSNHSVSARCNPFGYSQSSVAECNPFGCPNPPSGKACTPFGCPSSPQPEPPRTTSNQSNSGDSPIIILPGNGNGNSNSKGNSNSNAKLQTSDFQVCFEGFIENGSSAGYALSQCKALRK